MVKLYPMKELSIVTIDSLEQWVVMVLNKHGVHGYTILPARGQGSSGIESEMTGLDANIFVKAILPDDRLEPLLECLNRKIASGHHLTVFIKDVQVINPRKFGQSVA